ncbi:hypothetical protein N7451_010260 [Penicillium sp. IBT 35674x]|nr:hypothetical protein N7451_010260 [Penicillium sp. IBT 35674x]
MSEDFKQNSESRGAKRKREPTGSRRRTSLACDICRKQKEKCEGGQPCWRCQRLDRKCQFTSQPAPQKPSRSLQEDANSPSPQPSDQYLQNLEHIVRHFLGDVSLDEENIARIAANCTSENQETETSEEVHESHHVHFVSSNVAFYSGEFSHWNFSEKLRRTMRCRDTSDSSVKEYWRATHLQSSNHTVAEAITHLPPRPIAEFLVGVFFKYTEVNSFYVEKGWMQEKLQLCYSPLTDLTAADIPWVCSVFAVLAIGTQFTHMEEDRSNPDSSLSEEIAFCSEDSVGLGFFHVACKLGHDVILAASYESVQAFLLLAVYALPVSCGGLSYTYFGLAMKMAIQNGMHKKYVGGDCDRRTLELRNRLFWTVYTLERRTAIMHGRPNSIAQSEISTDLPTNCPTFDSPNFSSMMTFIDLVSWTGEVADTLAKFKRCPKRLLPEYSGRLMHLRSKIRQWWSSRSIDAQGQDTTLQGRLSRQDCHMKLCYLLIYVYMGRPFIFNARRKEDLPENQTVERAQRSELVNDCVQSALEIIEVLQTLADDFGLCRASYTEFSSCRAALLVVLAESLNTGRTAKLQEVLNRGMTLIRQMTGGTSTQSEISYIESIETAVRQWSSNDESYDQDTSIRQSSTSAYATFKDWTQSMKKNNSIGSRVELSSFSPISHLTSSAESAFNPDINDLTDLLNEDWVTSDLGLDPEVFLIS